jgi:hypothetical protein
MNERKPTVAASDAFRTASTLRKKCIIASLDVCGWYPGFNTVLAEPEFGSWPSECTDTVVVHFPNASVS